MGEAALQATKDGALLLTVTDGTGRLTQVELARRFGKPQSFVSAYEGGLRRVDLIEFLFIARALGADPVDIFAEIVRSWSK